MLKQFDDDINVFGTHDCLEYDTFRRQHIWHKFDKCYTDTQHDLTYLVGSGDWT